MLSSFYYGLDVVVAARNEADDLMVMVMMVMMRRDTYDQAAAFGVT